MGTHFNPADTNGKWLWFVPLAVQIIARVVVPIVARVVIPAIVKSVAKAAVSVVRHAIKPAVRWVAKKTTTWFSKPTRVYKKVTPRVPVRNTVQRNAPKPPSNKPPKIPSFKKMVARLPNPATIRIPAFNKGGIIFKATYRRFNGNPRYIKLDRPDKLRGYYHWVRGTVKKVVQKELKVTIEYGGNMLNKIKKLFKTDDLSLRRKIEDESIALITPQSYEIGYTFGVRKRTSDNYYITQQYPDFDDVKDSHAFDEKEEAFIYNVIDWFVVRNKNVCVSFVSNGEKWVVKKLQEAGYDSEFYKKAYTKKLATTIIEVNVDNCIFYGEYEHLIVSECWGGFFYSSDRSVDESDFTFLEHTLNPGNTSDVVCKD